MLRKFVAHSFAGLFCVLAFGLAGSRAEGETLTVRKGTIVVDQDSGDEFSFTGSFKGKRPAAGAVRVSIDGASFEVSASEIILDKGKLTLTRERAVGITQFDATGKSFRIRGKGAVLSGLGEVVRISTQIGSSSGCQLYSKRSIGQTITLLPIRDSVCLKDASLSITPGNLTIGSEQRVSIEFEYLGKTPLSNLKAITKEGKKLRSLCNLRLSQRTKREASTLFSYTCQASLRGTGTAELAVLITRRKGKKQIPLASTKMRVLSPVDQSQYDLLFAINSAVESLLTATIGSSELNETSRLALARGLRQLEGVRDVAFDAGGVDILLYLDSGITGVVSIGRRRGAQALELVASEQSGAVPPGRVAALSSAGRTVIFHPVTFDDGKYDEGFVLNDLLSSSTNPIFQVEHYLGARANLSTAQGMLAGTKTLIIVSHGVTDKNGITSFMTGEGLLDRQAQEAALRMAQEGHVWVGFHPLTYWVTSRMIKSAPGEMDSALVLLDHCYSYENSDLVEAFVSKGASNVLGYTRKVYSPFATKNAKELFCNMLFAKDDVQIAHSKIDPKVNQEPFPRGFNEELRLRSTGEFRYPVDEQGVTLDLNDLFLDDAALYTEEASSVADEHAFRVRLGEEEEVPQCLSLSYSLEKGQGVIQLDAAPGIPSAPYTPPAETSIGKGVLRLQSKVVDQDGIIAKLKVQAKVKDSSQVVGEGTGTLEVVCDTPSSASLKLSPAKPKPSDGIVTATLQLENQDNCPLEWEWLAKSYVGEDEVPNCFRFVEPVESLKNKTSAQIDISACSIDDPSEKFVWLKFFLQSKSNPRTRTEKTKPVAEAIIDFKCVKCDSSTSFSLSSNANQCVNPRETCCEDNEDNDGDGNIDCEDTDCSQNLVQNGDFSAGLTHWVGFATCGSACYGVLASSVCAPFHTDNAGFLDVYNGSGVLRQTGIALPNDGRKIELLLRVHGQLQPTLTSISLVTDGIPTALDSFIAPRMVEGYTFPGPVFTCTDNQPAYVRYDVSSFAGKTVEVRFNASSSGNDGTFAIFDGVRLIAYDDACVP